jgi:lipid A ethanolaminephosphotransferase
LQKFLKWIGALKFSLISFVSIVCVFNLIAFQSPLLNYALSVSDLTTSGGVVQIISLQILQIFLLAASLFFLSGLSVSLMRWVIAVLFICNAFGLYFMISYGIEIDRSMIANVFNTDSREATELLHISVVVPTFFLGLLPAFFILAINVDAPKRIWRFGYAIGSVLVLAIWLMLTSFTMLWYDNHASRMGGKILPWSYIVNTARYFNRSAMDNRQQTLLPDGYFLSGKPAKKEVVVLVIGEAARADNFSLLGYEKNTNPFTRNQQLAIFPIGLSCSTNTISSAACILTHEGRQAPSRTKFEPLPSYLTRHGITTIYRTNNSGPPPVNVDIYQTTKDISESCTDTICPTGRYDDTLIWKLDELLDEAKSNRVFVTLHLTGSHGPAYYKKYPPQFEHFAPVCKTVQIAKCTEQELINAYDNTIRFTDSVISNLITQLKKLEQTNATMIYVSDHGQSLGENSYYLHGAPIAIAPPEQRRIPFLVWMSDGFKKSRGLTNSSILKDTTHPHDYPFHSVMGAFNMRSEIYKPNFDIFNITDGGS